MPSPSWLSAAVWVDYRLAVLFTVVFPIALLIWAFVEKSEPVQHLLIIYWRVASLLAVTVYLFIGALPIGFITGWIARLLIPVSLWFWIDLNEEIVEQRPSPLKAAFTAWRWAVSIYSVLGAVAQIPSLRCALLESKVMKEDAFCRTWLQPPWGFRELFHGGTPAYSLGFIGLLLLGIYVLYLAYFLFFRLGKQGRFASDR